MFSLAFRFPFLFIIVFSLSLCVSAVNVLSQGLPLAKPADVGMDAAKLDRIEELVLAGIADKKLPGAVVVVGRKGKVVYRKAFGNRSLVPTVEPMTVDTIFDVASLTKPVATATSIMILIEEGILQLNDTVGKFIPDLEDEQLKSVTIQQLLTHTSGLKPSFDLSEKWTGREGMLAALKKEKLRNPPGTKFVYSDIGFMVLGEIVNAVTGFEVDKFVAQNIFEPLATGSTLFLRYPESGWRGTLSRVAPTENIRGQNSYLGSKFEGDPHTGNKILRGVVHDPTAFRMGGVAGHAGLFSTADDLARYCQMILNGGSYGGRRILSTQTVAMMTRPYVVSETGATRGLGWDMNTTYSRNRGELFPLGSFGHTGFTGTSIWIDPTSETFVVFLSNRVHPDGKGDVGDLRAKVSTVVASAITDVPVEKWREAEARYFAAVNAQIAAFPKTQQPK
jgi:CubicO group peptidase (beta-lactamase class C family)